MPKIKLTPAETVGRRVADLRAAAGLTRNALAVRAGVDPGFLGHIERGTKRMSLETAQQLTEALDVSLAEFDREKIIPRKLV